MEEILQPKLKWRIYQKNYMGFIHLSWLAGFLPSTVSWLRFSSYSSRNSADDTWPARTNTCDGPIDDIRKHRWRLYHQRWNPRCSKSKASKMPKCNKNKRKNIRNISETSKIARKYVFSWPIIKGNHFYSFGRTVWEIYSFFHKVVKNSETIIFNTKFVDRGFLAGQHSGSNFVVRVLMPSCICKTIF